MSRPSTFFGASKRTVTTTHKKRMIRTIDDDAGAFLRRIARDVFSLSFCLSLSLSLSVFRIPNNTQRRERDDILERQNFRERRERRIELLGSPPFQNISPLFFVCTALFRVLHFCKKGSQKKNRQIAPQKKRKKDTGQPSLRLEFSRHKSPLSLSAFITPPLEEGQPKAFFGGGRRRRRRRRRRPPFRFVERRRKSARERILFVSCVCGRIQIQTRESKRYPGIRIFRWRLYRSSDSGAWGHVLCAARRLFFFVRFKTREKKKRWVRRGLVAMVIVGIADDAWHRRR